MDLALLAGQRARHLKAGWANYHDWPVRFDLSKKKRARTDSDQWNAAISLRRSTAAVDTAAAASEALRAANFALEAKYMAHVAEQIALDRSANEAAKASTTS